MTPANLVGRFGPETTVVTPTPRLSRELHNRFQINQVEQGMSAWPTPDIIPFETWLKRIWRHPETNGGDRILLNGLQQDKVWSAIIENDLAGTAADTAPLWNIAASTSQAVRAWRLIHQWGIPLDQCASSWLEDHRRFAAWAIRYEQQCGESKWVDDARLPDAITDHGLPAGVLPNTLICAGFDSLSPQQTRLLKRVEEAGCAVEVVQLQSNSNHDVEYRRYLDSDSQWLAAAEWAKGIASTAPGSRVGIIVPDLETAKGAIEHAFAQQLDPESLFNARDTDAVYHLSLGKPLSEYPIVKTVFDLLILVTEDRILSSRLGDVLTSPFIRGAGTEKASRVALESTSREFLPWEIQTRRVEAVLGSFSGYDSTPVLKEALRNVVGLRPEPGEKRSYGQCADLIAQVLAAYGWPGDQAPDSDEYQAIEAFREQLGQIRSLDLVAGGTTLAGALSELQARLRLQPFQPETVSSPVEILGVVESAGLEFDALWFGNHVTGSWPPEPTVNPFIPRSAQTQVGIPAADHRTNLDYYCEITRRRLRLSASSVFSRQQSDGDIKLLPGALFEDPPETSAPPQTLVEQLMNNGSEIELLQDIYGAPFSLKNSPGGTGLITSQSACPYQAYARYRLGAGYVDYREPGMDALDRGSLLHDALEKVWEMTRTSKRLQEMDLEGRREMINDAVSNALNRFAGRRSLGRGYADSLHAWLTRLVDQWLGLEALREQDFSVVATEQDVDLELADLRLSFRIDRVDRLASGSTVLIDYKSGQTPGVARWVGDPPQYRSEYPQLGLYAVAAKHSGDSLLQGEIEALLVATLKLGAERFAGFTVETAFFGKDSGVSQAPSTLDRARNLEEALKDWGALIEQWESSFTNRISEFKEGYAEVDPLPGACVFCDLQTLCRIQELGKQVTADD